MDPITIMSSQIAQWAWTRRFVLKLSRLEFTASFLVSLLWTQASSPASCLRTRMGIQNFLRSMWTRNSARRARRSIIISPLQEKWCTEWTVRRREFSSLLENSKHCCGEWCTHWRIMWSNSYIPTKKSDRKWKFFIIFAIKGGSRVPLGFFNLFFV